MPRTRASAATRSPDITSARLAPIVLELEQWRARAVPDAAAPLDGDDVARLVRDCFTSLGIEPDVAQSFSVNTVHFYRRKDILDEPVGRTSAARYTLRHVWQAAGARLAGFLGLVTLAEARDEMRRASDDALVAFVAARIADARGRHAARSTPTDVRPLRATPAHRATATAPVMLTATIVPLGGNAMCLIPAGHPALHSPAAARLVVDALAASLGVDHVR